MNLQEELKELKERITEVEEQIKREQAFPREDDEYWYIDDEGNILKEVWDGLDFEESRFAIGNVFHTENEAEFAVEKLKVEAILRKYSRPFSEDENNYYIEFYLLDKALSIDCEDYFQSQGTFYFDSEKTALQAIDEAGEWQIKRFIFGMEV